LARTNAIGSRAKTPGLVGLAYSRSGRTARCCSVWSA
jgi:hypothetical protein